MLDAAVGCFAEAVIVVNDDGGFVAIEGRSDSGDVPFARVVELCAGIVVACGVVANLRVKVLVELEGDSAVLNELFGARGLSASEKHVADNRIRGSSVSDSSFAFLGVAFASPRFESSSSLRFFFHHFAMLLFRCEFF